MQPQMDFTPEQTWSELLQYRPWVNNRQETTTLLRATACNLFKHIQLKNDHCTCLARIIDDNFRP